MPCPVLSQGSHPLGNMSHSAKSCLNGSVMVNANTSHHWRTNRVGTGRLRESAPSLARLFSRQGRSAVLNLDPRSKSSLHRSSPGVARFVLPSWTSWDGLSHAGVSRVTCPFLLGERHYSMKGSLQKGVHRTGVSPQGRHEEGLKNRPLLSLCPSGC